MDLLFLYFLHLGLLCTSLSLLFLFYNRKSSNVNLPPGKTGWPIFGETWAFFVAGRSGSPEKFVEERMNKYSPDVFKTSLLGNKMAVVSGPSASKFLFSSDDKYVTTWWPQQFKKILHDTDADAGVVDGFWKENTGKLRRFLPEFLKPEALQHYVPIMDSMAKKHFEMDWCPHKQVTVMPLSKKYTFALACRLFMSLTDPDHVARFASLFLRMTKGILSLPINFPGTNYNRAIKAGRMMREELLAVIEQRKREFTSENYKEPEAIDILTRMVLISADENGIIKNDKEIADQINGLLHASHDTTTSAITMVIYYISDHPDVYKKVLKEQMEIAKSKAPGELLRWQDIQKMKYSWCVACEAMRLSSPALGVFREAIADFSYAGFTIPKGWKVHLSAQTAHKNSKYFPDPKKFDPSRFEGNGPAPYTYVPFGGGPRMCPGKEYTRLAILSFMHNVVTKFKWEKVIPEEMITHSSFPMPVNGLPIYLQPLEN